MRAKRSKQTEHDQLLVELQSGAFGPAAWRYTGWLIDNSRDELHALGVRLSPDNALVALAREEATHETEHGRRQRLSDLAVVLEGATALRQALKATVPPDPGFVALVGMSIATSSFRQGLHRNGIFDLAMRADGLQRQISEVGRLAADARHNQPGGSREKARAIREIWASGKYSSRDICAEQECAALDMSFSSARKHLRGTPDPS